MKIETYISVKFSLVLPFEEGDTVLFKNKPYKILNGTIENNYVDEETCILILNVLDEQDEEHSLTTLKNLSLIKIKGINYKFYLDEDEEDCGYLSFRAA